MINEVRPIRRVMEGRRRGQAENVANRGGQVLRRLRVGVRVTAYLSRGTYHRAAAHAPACEEDSLHQAPVISDRKLR